MYLIVFSCMFIVARPRVSPALSGQLMILMCSQKPVGPVNWTFHRFSDPKAEDIVTEGLVVSRHTERFGITGSSLIIYQVLPSDDGLYECCDSNKDVFAYCINVIGEEITVILRTVKCN